MKRLICGVSILPAEAWTAHEEETILPRLRATIVQVTPFEQNCTVFWNEESKRGAVVDPGGDLDRVRAAIEANEVIVEKIFLTHGHIDHAGGAAELRDSLGVPLEGPHRADRILLDNLQTQGQAYGIAEARNVTPNRWLDQGDEVEAAGFRFAVLHCPGHSPGSVVFVQAEKKLAIVGDVLFNGSVGRTDLPGGDHVTLIRSIEEKLLPLGDDVAFVCGHGPTSTIGRERATNPFLA